MQSVLSILEALETEFSIDGARRFVTGYSAGSVGSFDVITKHPGVFSAAVPISGGFDPDVISNDGNARVWSMHGHNDGSLAPYWSRSSVHKIVELGGTGISLEPPGGHDAAFRSSFFTDRDNELYPWLFEGIDPPLAQLVYDPANGNVKIDAEKAPGGMISKMTLEVPRRVSFIPPEITEINGDELSVSDTEIQYTANNADGFVGILNLGNILPPGLNYLELHDSLSVFQYASPASTSRDRTFRLMIHDTILGDFDVNGVVDIADIDLLANVIRSEDFDPRFDLDGSTTLGHEDLAYLVTTVIGTWIGDSNLDGEFNTGDLVSVFQTGHYEDEIPLNSGWAHGDWNGDADFDTSDLVHAFQDGGFEQGPRTLVVAPVPEPSAALLMFFGLASLVCVRKPKMITNSDIWIAHR